MRDIAALAAVKIFLTRGLGLAALTFLALTVLGLSCPVRPCLYWCNIAEVGYALRLAGWTAGCCYAALGTVFHLLLLTVLTQLPLPVSDLIWWSCWLLVVLCWAIALLGIRYERGRLLRWGSW